jgi:hypothetical protein
MIYQVRNYWDRGIKVIERPVIRETPKFVIVPDLYSANYVDRRLVALATFARRSHSAFDCDAEIKFVNETEKT